MSGGIGDVRKDRSLVAKVLSHPEVFPDEFKSWLPRYLAINPNFLLTPSSLPKAEDKHYVDGAGNSVFLNSWAAYGSGYEDPFYYLDLFGVVHIGGVMASGVIGSAAFSLPTSYRPDARLMFAVVTNNDAIGRVDVLETGDVLPVSGDNAYVSLGGISFRAT